jgi:hypothetical protein
MHRAVAHRYAYSPALYASLAGASQPAAALALTLAAAHVADVPCAQPDGPAAPPPPVPNGPVPPGPAPGTAQAGVALAALRCAAGQTRAAKPIAKRQQ